ncbi:MAG: FemAB family PEP-CTERM system-associated protein [Planctomycetes bacterium]|nr:FemAB family PEP-CTERM system-associated protein [Planctomycetota bacterium]
MIGGMNISELDKVFEVDFCEIESNHECEIKFLCGSHKQLWDEYIYNHPHGTVFHLLAWSEAVQKAYKHYPLHLTAWADQQLIGILPLFLVKSIFVGNVLISIPYATYGGILSDSDNVAKALLSAAKEICNKIDVEYLELRHREANVLNLPEIRRYDTFRKRLPEHPDEVLPWLPRKTRAAARKGLKVLSVHIGTDLLEAVYDLYVSTMRRLGSPNYSKQFWIALQEMYKDDCVVLVVEDNKGPVAGVVSFIFRDEIVPYFSGSNERGMDKNANNVMYLKLMEYAVERGIKWFDFNRTRRDNPGPYAFKRHHGFEPTPLHYQVMLCRAKKLPNLSPSNRKFAMVGRIWRRLPLSFTRTLGARITKWIP